MNVSKTDRIYFWSFIVIGVLVVLAAICGIGYLIYDFFANFQM